MKQNWYKNGSASSWNSKFLLVCRYIFIVFLLYSLEIRESEQCFMFTVDYILSKLKWTFLFPLIPITTPVISFSFQFEATSCNNTLEILSHWSCSLHISNWNSDETSTKLNLFSFKFYSSIYSLLREC